MQKFIEAAQGKIPSDLIYRDVSYLDVFSCQWKRGDVAIFGGKIAGLDPGLKAKRVIEASGRFLVPGFIDAHVHLESSLMGPAQFEAAVLARGTTSAICDPHELANVLGVAGIEYFLEASSKLNLNLKVMLSSCVPATNMETNGGGTIGASDLLILKSRAGALGLAEMMNVPGVIHGDHETHAKLRAFSDRPIDGHCPLLKGLALSAYAGCGISSCHESSELAEAREKLTKGISVWIREGSVAKDLKALMPLLNMATSTSLGFCTDDRNPLDIAEQGHVDYLVRESIRGGVPSPVVYRTASWSVARHYGLSQGPLRMGAIAPGYVADLVFLNDAETCSVEHVLKSGSIASELSVPKIVAPEAAYRSLKAEIPDAHDLEGPHGQVHVIGAVEGKIITSRSVESHAADGVMKLSVLERHGHGLSPANGYVRGFGNLNGAIASSVGHDSHNLIVVGNNTRDMREALAALIASGGGFSVVQGSKVLEHLALPVGGLMCDLAPAQIASKIRQIKSASKVIGCELSEPFLQLAFLSLPVIPSLKLTDRGLVDVDLFKIIDVRAS